MIKKHIVTIILACGLILSGCATFENIVLSGKLTPTELRCEYTRDPLGIDAANPRLFWKLESNLRSQKQSAYQILVASSLKNMEQDKGDLWNSGKVESDRTIQIPYEGVSLESSQQVFWKVRVWDKDGGVSSWSKPATWTMGILNEDEWKARWIGAEQESQTIMLRHEFTVKAGLKRAVAHVCGLGHYEISVNGEKVGDDILSPGWTKYNKTCLYDTRELTPLLKEGDNAVGLLLGNGMYNVKGGRYVKFKGSYGPIKAICQIRLEYDEGTAEIIGTNKDWLVKAGPITFSCVFGGEDYDSRLEPHGWNRAGFNNSHASQSSTGWAKAQEVESPGGKLKGLCFAAPPIKTFDILKPVTINQLRPGTQVYDLGQNAALIPRLKTKGPAGSIVRIIPAELLNRDGSVDRRSCAGGRPGYWQYTLSGTGSEEWFPKFFYHGSRYLQVECMPAEESESELPVVENLEGVVVHSSSEPIGRFVCSNDLFNRIHQLVRWAQRSNMVSVLTDCPHREKLGWLEQYHLNGPSIRYEFDLARLFTKGMKDMADSQRDDGLVPNHAPEYVVFGGNFTDSPEWSSAFLLVAWQQYLWNGDSELIRNYYDDMKRYVAYLDSQATNNIVSHGLGDWYDIGPKAPGLAQLTPVPLTATAFYYYDSLILSRMAELLGKTDEAKKFAQKAAEIRDAFNKEFYNPATEQYATGSQCSNAVPLFMGLVEPENRRAVLDAIVRDVTERGNALTAGDVGYRYLLRALAENGRSDVIYAMNNQSEKPGYGYQLKMGATSLTEAWSARRYNSQNHFMLGQIMEWFYCDLAGISTDPTGPGYKKIIIKPQPVADLTFAKASYNSICGEIVSDWKHTDDSFILKVAIPANTTATVFVPAGTDTEITESGIPAQNSSGVKFLRHENNYAVYEIGSGEYEFQSHL
ncbi:MAG: glycoside hydrolase family 78 protein [Sedimentisphaerales bacterium]|nr:glycoside hydrolase family 78 protein [Sedimentisphaerales bacterium]